MTKYSEHLITEIQKYLGDKYKVVNTLPDVDNRIYVNIIDSSTNKLTYSFSFIDVEWDLTRYYETLERVYSKFPDYKEETESTDNTDEQYDIVNKPEHYASTSIECIDAMIETQGKEAVIDFCICNAFKYLWRRNKKNGIEDLRKCKWYINKCVELLEQEDS